MCMFCQRHENNGVLKADVKILNFGIYAHLPNSFYQTERTKSNILKELKLITAEALIPFNFYLCYEELIQNRILQTRDMSVAF